MMKVKAAVFLATLCLTLSLIACQTQTTTKSGETTLSSELSSERVWINTRYGLTVLSSDGWHSFYEGATVFDIALDPQEKLWAVTREDLSYFDGMKFVVSSKSHKADEIDIDDQDRLWLAGVWAGSGYGVGLYNGEEWTPFALRDYGLTDISAGSFRDIQVDDDGQVWVATSKGLVMFDQQEWKKPVSPVSDQAVHCLAIDDMGKLWVGHGDGLSIFDGASWTTWTGSDMDLMGSVMVESIAFDDDGNVWLCVPHKGLLTYDGTSWKLYDTSNSALPTDLLQAVAVDDQGRVWIGTDCGISVFDGVEWTNYNMSNSGLTSDDVSKILIGKGGPASLPSLLEIKVGELSGVIKQGGKAMTGARVMLCTDVMGTIPGVGFGGETPCEGPVQIEAFVDETGGFRFTDVPIGKYQLAVQSPEDKWFTIMAESGVPVPESFKIEEGKTTSVGVLNIGE